MPLNKKYLEPYAPLLSRLNECFLIEQAQACLTLAFNILISIQKLKTVNHSQYLAFQNTCYKDEKTSFVQFLVAI